jgi:hypothetical protein
MAWKPISPEGRMRIRIFICAVALVTTAFAKESFTDNERQTIKLFWSEPGRYKVEPAMTSKGVWLVRETPEGSKWLWNYNKARGLSKGNPAAVPGPLNQGQVAWENWINAKVSYDRWQASKQAGTLNAQLLGKPVPDLGDAPADPGPEPDDLTDLAGEAPSFADAVSPERFTVSLDDDAPYVFTDQVNVPQRYAYFRFSDGVDAAGTAVKNMPEDQLDELLKEAGISDSEARVMKAVSLLEGGFDTINTYDTGFLSVGFIQFATGSTGAGSLGQVMLKEKTDDPEEFADDFHKFGVDVEDDGTLVVVNPVDGSELRGADAVARVIEDKRLTAVFARAGKIGKAFQLAQLKVAKAGYYPAEDTVAVTVDGQKVTFKVSDIFKSEAGLATLANTKRASSLN